VTLHARAAATIVKIDGVVPDMMTPAAALALAAELRAAANVAIANGGVLDDLASVLGAYATAAAAKYWDVPLDTISKDAREGGEERGPDSAVESDSFVIPSSAAAPAPPPPPSEGPYNDVDPADVDVSGAGIEAVVDLVRRCQPAVDDGDADLPLAVSDDGEPLSKTNDEEGA
jgi:hypothetical protein